MRKLFNRESAWAVCVFLGLVVLTVAAFVGTARGQQAGTKPATTPPATVPAPAAVHPDHELDQLVNQAKEEIELMQLQLDAKKALLRIGEARLEDAKHWKEHYAALLRDHKVTEERYLAARDDVLMMEAHVASERADVRGAEMRLKYANRRLAYGEFNRSPVDRRLAEIEQRLADHDTKIDLLQHEVGRARREAQHETQFGPK